MIGNSKLTRSEHVASLALPPGHLALTLGLLRRGDVMLKISLCAVAGLIMWLVTTAWEPPFGYRTGEIPSRNIVAQLTFEIPDSQATEQLRKQKRSEMACVYMHDDRPLKELRSALQDRIFRILAAKSFDHVDQDVWQEFVRDDEKKPADESDEAEFDHLCSALKNNTSLAQFDRALQRAFQQFEDTGLLKGLQHRPDEGSQISILEYPLGRVDALRRVDVSDVRIAEATADMKNRLEHEFQAAGFREEDVALLVRLVDNWLLRHGLPTTLKLDTRLTQQRMDKALGQIHVEKTITPGDKLVPGGVMLDQQARDLLYREYQARMATLSIWQKVAYSLSAWGMYVALFVLCGTYIYFHQPYVLRNVRQLSTLLTAVVLAVAMGRLFAVDAWQAEIVPITMFGMTITIAYCRDLALLLSFVVVLSLCLLLGFDLAQFVVLVATSSTAVLLLGRIRSRTKLIYVGIAAGAAALLSTIGIGIMTGKLFGPVAETTVNAVNVFSLGSRAWQLMSRAAWNGAGTVMAGVIMTGLLPFVERFFDVQTDISLLELGDAAHPLLQELARRAPGTYNHSITVASLAEAAAETIGANGLLARVGAYFHDIGKVFKPAYFIENQERETNLHESLVPAMSTLVIIAHVKDGEIWPASIDSHSRLLTSLNSIMARHWSSISISKQRDNMHRIPIRKMSRRVASDTPVRDRGTRETGVLMLADAVEGASRTLVDPTPAHIESLVRQIAMKRLLDGQFDDCGMTLQELSMIEDSLVKSLMAVYHVRVKYPDQDTA